MSELKSYYVDFEKGYDVGDLYEHKGKEYEVVAIEAFKRSREIFAASALKPYGGEELQPGSHVNSDKAILNYIRETGEPVHHLAGSCKMGNDAMAVVDPQLRVYGVEGLRAGR